MQEQPTRQAPEAEAAKTQWLLSLVYQRLKQRDKVCPCSREVLLCSQCCTATGCSVHWRRSFVYKRMKQRGNVRSRCWAHCKMRCTALAAQLCLRAPQQGAR